MKKIGIDARMMFSTGIGTYLRSLLAAMPENRGDFSFTLFGVPAQGKAVLPGAESVPFDARIYSLKEQIEYPAKLKKCDLWHAPHYNAPFVKGKTKLVITVHDLIHWIFRKDFFSPLQAFYAGTMFRNAVKRADHIIAVSKKTADDLVFHFNAKPHHISVIHESVSPDFVPAAGTSLQREIKNKYRLPDKFLLYVGSLKPHKNIQTLLEAFRGLRSSNKMESGLVIIGKKDGNYPARLKALAELETGGGVIYLPEIGGGELPAFYQTAQALVHPSLYEGFGLTLLEAMACGTPVIASTAGSIPEVAGKAALFVDPHSKEEIARAMMRLESEPSLAAELRELGFQNLKGYSWKEAAVRTLEVYKRVLGSR